jgi:hypothetical protein
MQNVFITYYFNETRVIFIVVTATDIFYCGKILDSPLDTRSTFYSDIGIYSYEEKYN